MKRIALAVAFLTLAGCSSSSDPAPAATPKTSVAKQTVGDLTVELLTDTRLETGLTPVWVSVKNAAGQPVTDATVNLVPMMAMAGPPPFEHSAPTFGCAAMVVEEAMYHCDVVFQMMTTPTGGSWRADVTVTRPGAAPVDLSFDPITIEDSGCAKVFTYTNPTTQVATRYVASMDFVSAPKVGLNPVVITLHTRADMMTFPPVENAVITLDPQMPSMGHGSPGSVDPVMTSPGVYEGKLSFSMDGPWETTVTFKVGDVVVGAPVFKTTF